MRERINVILGTQPVLFIAPHGPDDTNTAHIAETAATLTNGYAVINQGFERGDKVDVDNDIADCNRVDHCMEDVICDEYLKQIIKIKDKINKRPHWKPTDPYGLRMLILHIHGAGNHVHQQAGEQIDVIIGYGRKNDNLIQLSGGDYTYYSCPEWRKDLFIHCCNVSHFNVGNIYEGSAYGKYAGRGSNNMNQYFIRHHRDLWVDSLQLEFPYSKRTDLTNAQTTAIILAGAVNLCLKKNSPIAHNISRKFI